MTPRLSVPTAAEDALAEAGVRFAYLFGSRASSQARDDSDADVAVMPGPQLELMEQSRLAGKLADALGAPEADIVLLDRADLELRGRILEHGLLIYSNDEPRRVAFEVQTLGQYLDYLPTLRELERSYLRHVAAYGL